MRKIGMPYVVALSAIVLIIPALGAAAWDNSDYNKNSGTSMSGTNQKGAATSMMAANQAVTIAKGTVMEVTANTVKLTAPDGTPQTVAVAPDTIILNRQPATMDAIEPGTAVGVAARKGADGSLTATSINIFAPDFWKVVRKGQWPMDDGQVMTNAVINQYTVEQMKGSTMVLKYQDVSATIAVPDTVQIHKLVPVALKDLKAGMQVGVRGTGGPGGSIRAASITFDSPAQG